MAINAFLEQMDVTVPAYTGNPELERHVDEVLKIWNIGDSVRRHVVTGIAIADTSYAHVSSIEIQVLIAVYTVVLTSLDDPGSINALPSEEFSRCYLTGFPVKDMGLLGKFATILRNVWSYYSRYAAFTITSSTLEFLNSTILENETKDMILSSNAAAFLEYRRIKTGVAEAYAHFIWDSAKFPHESAYIQAIPDTLLYVNYVNDIFSFYKEEDNGETGNYISDRALVEQKSSLEALQSVIEKTMDAVERIRRILGDGGARDVFESFARGYIAFHFAAPRYRLHEVVDKEYFMS